MKNVSNLIYDAFRKISESIARFLNIIKNKKFSKLKCFIFLLSIIYVVSVYQFMKSDYGNLMRQTNGNIYNASEMSRGYEINGVILKAEKKIRAGDLSGAINVVDLAIDDSVDNYRRCMLLMEKATLYLNIDDYDMALKYSLEGLKFDKNDAVYDFIAQVYEKQSKFSNALEAYKKAYILIDKTKPAAEDDMDYLNYKIKELSNYDN